MEFTLILSLGAVSALVLAAALRPARRRRLRSESISRSDLLVWSGSFTDLATTRRKHG